ncbi:MAG: glycosyltransferase family 4 protein [Lachnospiraceae bacterium]|nr:glycosyltransferase family 4 protein [Lachnospiraceae bacterium]
MKKILFITETVIMPIDRGNRKRNFNLINSLKAKGAEVDILYLDTYSEDDPALTKEWAGEGHFYSIRNKKRSFPVFIKRKIRKLLEILHFQVAFKYFSLDERVDPDLPAHVADFIKDKGYDQVWVSCVYNSAALLNIPEGIVKVIDTVNVSSVKRQEYEAVGYRNYEFALKKDVEKKGLLRADAVIAIQDEEESFFKEMLPSSVRTFTIGENLPLCKAAVSSSKKVLFLGSTYVINIEGFKFFKEEILPVLKKTCPEAEVVIAGSICSRIPDDPAYEKRGWVEDLDALYEEARLVINPVRHGAGLNIKMAEALSYAKPVVSTIRGMRGLRAGVEPALSTDDPEMFALYIRNLIRDDAAALELSKKAESFMLEYTKKNDRALEEILSL